VDKGATYAFAAWLRRTHIAPGLGDERAASASASPNGPRYACDGVDLAEDVIVAGARRDHSAFSPG
jgi:hypothetical protein